MSTLMPMLYSRLYFVPTAVCTHVLYTLIVTVQLSFLSDRSEHRIHPGDTTHTHDTRHTQMLSSCSPTKNNNYNYISYLYL